MIRTTASEVDRFREENVALFEERAELKEALSELDQSAPQDASERRRVRMLKRRIDEVTGQIVTFNMGLVRSYTRRFSASASTESREDFESAGLVGLMRAVDSYDTNAGAFGQWAFQPIRREVLRAVRDSDHPNLNLGDFEKRPAIIRALRQLQEVDDSYRPSDEEVAVVAGTTVTQVRRVLAPPRLESMNRPLKDGDDAQLADLIESKDPSPEACVLSKMTLAALETFGLTVLDPRELYVIVRRFGLDGEPLDKLVDIGDMLGLSREAVRQIEAKALAKLQHPMVLRKVQTPQNY